MGRLITPRRGAAALFILLSLFSSVLGADPGLHGDAAASPAGKIFFRFKIFPSDASVRIDGESVEVSSGPDGTFQCPAPAGPHEIRISREGYRDSLLFTFCNEEVNLIEEKLERYDSRLTLFACLPTGPQPKSVVFSPDGRYIYAPLLDGPGVDVFRVSDFTRIGRLTLPGKPPGTSAAGGPAKDPSGFVECAAVPGRGELWVSQMTTGQVHVFSLYGFRHLATIETGGEWSKVIRIDSKEQRAYVSNWLSRDISIIDMETKKLIDAIPVGGVPRGTAFSGGERYLYVCLYEGGGLVKVDLEKRKTVRVLDTGDSALRHILRDPSTNRFYISDMLNGMILVLDGDTDTLLRRISVGSNPNTIDLTSDGRYLFISTRGRNHPDGYLQKGLNFGKVSVLDTESLEIVDWTWGGNQPTGLALSPDGRLLAFSDFLDDRIEVYHVDGR